MAMHVGNIQKVLEVRGGISGGGGVAMHSQPVQRVERLHYQGVRLPDISPVTLMMHVITFTGILALDHSGNRLY